MTLSDPLPLAAILDTAAAGPLRLALRRAIAGGEPILVDGSAVDRAGLACLQVLAAGRTAAVEAALAFRIAEPSPALVNMATLAGFGELVTAR